MPKDDNHDAGPSAWPESPSDWDHDTSSSGFQQSARLREKLKKLANQRLDLSSIEFVDGAPEVRGGYATVSRAHLVSSSSGQGERTQSNPTKKAGLDFPGPAEEASRQRKVGATLPFGPLAVTMIGSSIQPYSQNPLCQGDGSYQQE